jgi:hypothetical protein
MCHYSRSRKPYQQWRVNFYEQEEWAFEEWVKDIPVVYREILGNEVRSPVLRRVVEHLYSGVEPERGDNGVIWGFVIIRSGG